MLKTKEDVRRYAQDFQEFLVLDFERRKNNNEQYSIGAYADNLGVSHGYLRSILVQEKRPSENFIKKCKEPLGLTESEVKAFIKLKDANILKEFSILSMSDAKEIKSWKALAIYSFININEEIKDSETIAKRLGLDLEITQIYLKSLSQMNLIKSSADGWSRIDSSPAAIKLPLINRDEKPSELLNSITEEFSQIKNERDFIRFSIFNYSSKSKKLIETKIAQLNQDLVNTIVEENEKETPDQVAMSVIYLRKLTE